MLKEQQIKTMKTILLKQKFEELACEIINDLGIRLNLKKVLYL